MMTMMDYGSQFTGSTISSETMSGSTGSVQPRIKTIRLVRPCNGTLPPPGISARHGPNLGFSVRGGREHGTGFFVSVVEPGSAAHRQGLNVGDQIIRINGFTIEDAIHKEVLQLISNHKHLILKVRSVGMIPVKDSTSDPLNWQIISDNTSSTRSSPQLNDKIQDVRLNIYIAPRSKLGCGICKGPDWKPGIFVQYTKEGGIARETGLRPGDQILSCNGVEFNDIHFNEAANIMKSSRQLDLLIRKSAGAELFPSESSGYNSSASSVTGDQSPSWSDSKRLSIVKEETHDLEDRLTQLDRLKVMKWDEWEDVCPYKSTIINVPGDDSVITNTECQDTENNVAENSNKLADICLISRQQETKTVVVEVHKSISEVPTKCKIAPSVASSSSDSLTSAIALEFQRRRERANSTSAIVSPTIDEQLQKNKILKGVDTDKQQQHSRLMDEFKKVHKKMFKSAAEEVQNVPDLSEKETLTERHNTNQIPPKPVERRSTLPLREIIPERTLTRSISAAPVINTATVPPPPPPPPPLPPTEDISKLQLNGLNSQPPILTQPNKTKVAPPVPTKYSTLSHLKDLKDKNVYLQPPPCPPPDYDTISINSSNNVEMDSLDSFRLNNPANVCPKPPNNYFRRPKSMLSAQLSNGSTTSSITPRNQRPVSVVIGEYPSGSLRKQPQKLDFLNGHSESSDECDRSSNGSISSQLAAELTNTLNRSNLRRRTESMENILNDPQIKPNCNGSVTISLNKNFAKSINSLNELCADNKSNCVTINISTDRKDDSVPNGILKNGNGNHKPLAQQKSITFGEMPTVINDLLKVS